MDQFTYVSAAQQVLFGPGSLAGLGRAVESFGWQRLLLCTIEPLESSGLVGQVAGILGGRLVATYARVQPHVPQPQVEAALALALENDIDAVIGLGGGSPFGLLQHLRDVGVAEPELAYLARVALDNKAVQNNPKPITSVVQTESVLRAAW